MTKEGPKVCTSGTLPSNALWKSMVIVQTPRHRPPLYKNHDTVLPVVSHNPLAPIIVWIIIHRLAAVAAWVGYRGLERASFATQGKCKAEKI